MADRPILFSAPMVRALIEGRKTQTRRLIRPAPPEGFERHCWYSQPVYGFTNEQSPTQKWHTVKLYSPGDRLWVREAMTEFRTHGSDYSTCHYPADHTGVVAPPGAMRDASGRALWPFRRPSIPSIHMPRWASRVTLTVTDVRVQRIKHISDSDAEAEGIFHWRGGWRSSEDGHPYSCPVTAFYGLWDSIHHDGKDAPHCIKANPWACALTFTVALRNIDAPEAQAA